MEKKKIFHLSVVDVECCQDSFDKPDIFSYSSQALRVVPDRLDSHKSIALNRKLA